MMSLFGEPWRTTEDSVNFSDISLSCPGGGRIELNIDEKTLLDFGYSQGCGREAFFGQASFRGQMCILRIVRGFRNKDAPFILLFL